MSMPPNVSTADLLRRLPESSRKRLIAGIEPERIADLDWYWPFWARPAQMAPPGPWTTWLVLAGRGFGKTRCGAEWVRGRVEGRTPLSAPQGGTQRIAFVAETYDDARRLMVEGDSGILAVTPPAFRPVFEPSKRMVTWANGAKGRLFSGKDPNALRGPQHDLAWADEFAKWSYPRATWDMLMFGLRIGANPQVCVTTTPLPIKALRTLLELQDTVVSRGTTFDNRANLSAKFFRDVVARYDGTRLGRQELGGELLDDVPGALWRRDDIDRLRVSKAPNLRRIVIAIDPAVTTGEEADETGIVVAGLGEDGHGYVIEDLSGHYSPADWGRRAVTAYHRHEADRVVAEVNNGGDMVEHVIRTIDHRIPYASVRASRGKAIRAEPIAALYEQGRVHHAGGFPELEDQMCMMTADFDRTKAGFSPDRLDASVWGLTELMLSDRKVWRQRKLSGY